MKLNGVVRGTRRATKPRSGRSTAPANARVVKDSFRTGTISRTVARAAVRAVMARRA